MSTDIRLRCLKEARKALAAMSAEFGPADVIDIAEGFAKYVEMGDIDPFSSTAEIIPLRAASHDDSPEEDVDEALRRSSELIRGERRVDYNDVLGPRTVVQNGNATALDQPGFDVTKVKFDGAHDASTRLGFGKS